HDRQQRPEQARRPDFAGACRLAHRLAVAEEQRWPRENHRLVAEPGDRVFHLALDAAVEDTRAGSAPSAEMTASRRAPASRARRAMATTRSRSTARKAASEPATLIVVPRAMYTS